MIIGFTCSAFDLLHAGHIIMLREAKSRCHKLIVGLQTDPTIDREWKNKPIQTLEERRIQLHAVKYIDEIIEYDTERNLFELLKKLGPDVRFLGEDYIGKEFTGNELPIKIVYLDRKHDYSSTELRKRIWEAENENRSIERNC